jgi:hypothetical protein
MIKRTLPPAAETPMIVPVAKGAEPGLEVDVDVADVEAEVGVSAGRLPVMVAARKVRSVAFVSTQENHRRVGEPSATYDSH